MAQLTQPSRRPATRDHLRKKKPVSLRCPVVLDTPALEAYESASEEYERAKVLAQVARGEKATEEAFRRLTAAEAGLQEAMDLLSEHVVYLRLRGIGQRYDKLILKHPPTEEQEQEAKKEGHPRPTYNVDTLAPELVHACLMEPADMPWDEFEEFWEECNQGEKLQMWTTALAVNQSPPSVPDLPKAFG